MATDSGAWPLHNAAMVGRLQEVRRLIRAGQNLNQFDEFSKTPLHWAADNEHLDVIRELIRSGADVNAIDDEHIGNTPLAQVAGRCSLELAKVLLDAGADPTIRGWMNMDAIARAKSRTDREGQEVHALLVQAAARTGR